MITVSIKGLEELQEKLKAMPYDVAKKVLRKDLRDAANELREAIVSAAPKESVFLSQHFNVRTRFVNGELAATAFVGPAGKTYYPNRGGKEHGVSTGKHPKKGGVVPVASVARFLEFGTSKMPAKPFMRPTFESKKDEILAKVIQGIKTGIAKWTK